LAAHNKFTMAESPSLFGTDGIRGIANYPPLTPEMVARIGSAAVEVIARGAAAKPKVVIGRDTRVSGDVIESALIAGMTSAGATVLRAGIVPTPAVALLTREEKATIGLVITASHNQFEDNGIKFFGGDGYKLSDEVESAISDLAQSGGAYPTLTRMGADLGVVQHLEQPLRRYMDFARATFAPGRSLSGLRIAVDAANGAASESTPTVLRELGADVHAFHVTPNGTNINRDCGSTFPAEIARRLQEAGAQVGLAHDGDADRLILCDELGEVLDGDAILAIAGLDYLRRGALVDNTLVATVMSNLGLDESLAKAGGKVVRTAVGDRHVLDEMVRRDLNVGGEQSGHLIFRDFSTTGDGLVGALQILSVMVASGTPLSELKGCLVRYPQAQRNLVVKRKPPIEELPAVTKLVADAERALAGRGRVLLRYSGTEAKVRLLLEGPDENEINRHAERIAAALEAEIG
jgi:phosphoglucosamine mutase